MIFYLLFRCLFSVGKRVKREDHKPRITELLDAKIRYAYWLN